LVEPRYDPIPIWQSARPIGTVAREQESVAIERFELYYAVPDHSTSTALLPHPAAE
jgi:hypothetical protein